ncbi:MAG TPA: DUF1345 domain-containing protein [Mycobacteriales bacterium]|jgi:uncharacterized membrane protein|nr:DUF1345 domain-containing protein [Mycobacteriales bacterium]
MRGSASRLVAIAAVIGVVVGVTLGVLYRAAVGPLAGFDVATLLYLAYVWPRIWPMDAAATSQHAASEDPTRASADALLLLAAVVSLGAVAYAIAQSHSAHGSTRGVEIGLGVGSVVMSWLLVHTIFTLKYARLYYNDSSKAGEGGIEFEHNVRPPYSDFAYLAFTIGMTFQVSDTDLQSVEYRRLALHHALLSYLFGAVILAATINLVAGLAS